MAAGADPEDSGPVWLPPAGLPESQGTGDRAADPSEVEQ